MIYARTVLSRSGLHNGPAPIPTWMYTGATLVFPISRKGGVGPFVLERFPRVREKGGVSVKANGYQ